MQQAWATVGQRPCRMEGMASRPPGLARKWTKGHVSCRREIGGLHLIGPRGRSGSQQMVPMSREQGEQKERKKEASHVFSMGPLHGQRGKQAAGGCPSVRDSGREGFAGVALARKERAWPAGLGLPCAWQSGLLRPGPLTCCCGPPLRPIWAEF